MTTNKKRSQRQEKGVAEDLDAKVQKGSGSSDFAKGDVRKVGELRVECKTTTKKSYSLTLAELMKIQLEALKGNDETWAMQIQFEGQGGIHKKVAVIDWYDFLELRKQRDLLLELEEENRILRDRDELQKEMYAIQRDLCNKPGGHR